MVNSRDLIKLVIDDSADCKSLIAWIQKNLKSSNSYLLELVLANQNKEFCTANNLTTFPVVFTNFSEVQTTGLFPCIHKLWEVYSSDERKVVPQV